MKKRKRRVQRSRRTTHSRKAFDLSDYTQSECMNFFRFSEFEIRKLANLLRIPTTLKCHTSTVSGKYLLLKNETVISSSYLWCHFNRSRGILYFAAPLELSQSTL